MSDITEAEAGTLPYEEWDGSEIDFAGIAERLRELEAYTREGWWGDYSDDPPNEDVLRTLGPIVRRAAEGIAELPTDGDAELESLAWVADRLAFAAMWAASQGNEQDHDAMWRAHDEVAAVLGRMRERRETRR